VRALFSSGMRRLLAADEEYLRPVQETDLLAIFSPVVNTN
jgi:hypothetical protein